MKHLALSLVVAAAAVCALLSADYTNVLPGKWKAIGTDCDENGKCKVTVNEDVWMQFNKDGTAEIKDRARAEKATWSIDGDSLELSIGTHDKIKLRIVWIKGREMLWENHAKSSMQKLERVD